MGKRKKMLKAAKKIKKFCSKRDSYNDCELDRCPFYDLKYGGCRLNGSLPLSWNLNE